MVIIEGEADFYDYLWKKNNGVFYRGTSGGKGMSTGVMGSGIYLSLERGVAEAFAKISSEKHGGTPKVLEYVLPKNLKFLDFQSATRWQIWKELGVTDRWAKISDKMFCDIVTTKMQTLGFDGVISDDLYDGILIFADDFLQDK